MKKIPNFNYEKKLWGKGYIVIGTDEVGRGACAGPVVASAFAFAPPIQNSKFKIQNYPNNQLPITNNKKVYINDSKKMTERQRETANKWLVHNCLGYQTTEVDVKYINKHGIGKAGISAMRTSISRLMKVLGKKHKYFVLTDYFYIPYLKGVGKSRQLNIKFGDRISYSIAASSIIAKVYRDRLMKQLSKSYPKYHWRKNKGYGTAAHVKAIKKYGKTSFHRDKFLRKCLGR